ncbi:hypothetical protein V8E54_002201 [Elaphomyces granulatus]
MSAPDNPSTPDNPNEEPTSIEPREDEPLLGRSGDVVQRQDVPIYYNLLTGAAVVAQAGVWILVAIVWSGIFSYPLILFSPHPLLNTTAILIQVQAILVLQPTSTPKQKILGTYIHFFLNILSILCFIAAFIVIEINKGDHPRFTSPHGIMGLVTYIFIILQALTGIAQFFAPVLVFGSVDNGKKIYKYHRVFGYVLLGLELGTVIAATQTSFNLTDLHIPLWSVLVSVILVLLGVGSRIRKSKFGFGR